MSFRGPYVGIVNSACLTWACALLSAGCASEQAASPGVDAGGTHAAGSVSADSSALASGSSTATTSTSVSTLASSSGLTSNPGAGQDAGPNSDAGAPSTGGAGGQAGLPDAGPFEAGSNAAGAGGSNGPAAGEGGVLLPEADALFIPQDLPNDEEMGAQGGMTLEAFTLQRGDSGLELYAAARNNGDVPSCQTGINVDLFGADGQVLASANTKLVGGRLYQLDAEVVLSCIAPGAPAMAAYLELPDTLELEQIASVVHRFPAFPGEVPAVEGELTVSDVQVVSVGEDSAYTGVVTNDFAAPALIDVYLFGVTRVGRPLAFATTRLTEEVAAGASAAFETSTVRDPGTNFVAFAEGSLVQ